MSKYLLPERGFQQLSINGAVLCGLAELVEVHHSRETMGRLTDRFHLHTLVRWGELTEPLRHLCGPHSVLHEVQCDGYGLVDNE